MRLGDILLAGGWVSERPTAASVIMAESGGNPDARNSTPCGNRADGSTAHAIGLGQVCTIHLDKGELLDGWDEDDLRNPVANVRAMKIIHNAQGWGAWEAYTNGSYRRFPDAINQDIQTSSNGGRALSTVAAGLLGPVGQILPNSVTDPITGALLGPITGGIVSGGNPITSALGLPDIGQIWDTVRDPGFWLRIAKVWFGGVLMILGLAGLVFIVAKNVSSATPIGQVRKALR